MLLRPSLLSLFLLLFLTTACQPEQRETAALPLDHLFTLKIDDVALEAQVAVTHREQSRGLMFREELPADQGMIFIYRAPQQMRFWMKNTPIHLDIGFFDADGVLREVHTMIAHDQSGTQSRRSDLRYALEMNAGWFRQAGVRPGAQLDLELLGQAIEARGFDSERYID